MGYECYWKKKRLFHKWEYLFIKMKYTHTYVYTYNNIQVLSVVVGY